MFGGIEKTFAAMVNGSRDQRLSNDQIDAIYEGLKAMKVCIPAEFARQPRLLDSVGKWKATECHQFLLYTGPIILKKILPSRHYNHFIALTVAIRILCDAQKYLEYNDYADQLLRWFVCEHKNLYGSNAILYNVHNLIYPANDCDKYGLLDNFSTFKFENHMSNIENEVKDAPKPLEQVVNRIYEENSLPLIRNIDRLYPVVKKLNDDEIISLEIKDFTVSTK